LWENHVLKPLALIQGKAQPDLSSVQEDVLREIDDSLNVQLFELAVVPCYLSLGNLLIQVLALALIGVLVNR